MKRPRTKTIPGFRIQPMLPMSIGTLGAVCEDADFTEYPDTGACVEALVCLGLLKNPYTLVLSIDQALAADIIERDAATEPCRCPVCNGCTDDPAGIHGRS